MKTLLCFGDSNTHGTVPMQTREEVCRFAFAERWPGVVQARLGPAWRVIEEGLPGRTSAFDDPEEGKDRNALRYWQACLQSHRPVDAITILLGTNDLKAKFQATPDAIADGVRALVETALDNSPPGHAPPAICVITPTPILELAFFSAVFAGGGPKSLRLPEAFARRVARPGVQLLHAGDFCAVSRLDGIHLDARAHGQLGLAVAQAIQQSEAAA